MWRELVKSVFFSNFFLGLLAVSLSFETSLQLGLPFNSLYWYLALFSGVVLYYTYAYAVVMPPGATPNPRSAWYRNHRRLVKLSQSGLLLVLTVSLAGFIYRYHANAAEVPAPYWAAVLVVLLAAGSYYGKTPCFNLRRSGWTKPFTIGLCWAATVSLFPLLALHAEARPYDLHWALIVWLFLKNWMFCAVNAILFDIKDYEDDSNRALKTFVVRYGIRFTIHFILLPLIAAGMVSFLLFARYRELNLAQVMLNFLPFFLTLCLALSLRKSRPILYYLIVVDGTLLIKALCGSIAVTLL